MKRIISILLALFMFVSMTSVVFADDSNNDEFVPEPIVQPVFSGTECVLVSHNTILNPLYSLSGLDTSSEYALVSVLCDKETHQPITVPNPENPESQQEVSSFKVWQPTSESQTQSVKLELNSWPLKDKETIVKTTLYVKRISDDNMAVWEQAAVCENYDEAQYSFVFSTQPVLGFVDVKPSSWYNDAVVFCSQREYMVGIGVGKFAPYNTMTRAMAITVLYRLSGETYNASGESFEDVTSGKWYYNAVEWAKARGITDGTDATHFSPNMNVTREQLVMFVYRFAQYKGMIHPIEGLGLIVSGNFADWDAVAKWAVEGMHWAVNNGIISGTVKPGSPFGHIDPTLYLNPKGNATRAEFAVITMRFCENILGQYWTYEYDPFIA